MMVGKRKLKQNPTAQSLSLIASAAVECAPHRVLWSALLQCLSNADMRTAFMPPSEFVGPRVYTLFLYLNDCPEGGSTKFPNVGIEVFPKRGRAVLWLV